MTQQLYPTTDALSRGELQFAIVERFNADTDPTDGSINVNGKPYYGDGSRDMTGAVRLMDGTILPFAYVDGRFPCRGVDGMVRWDEEGYSPASGGRGMSWPIESSVIMVEVEGSSVRRWTWPSVVLGAAYHCSDYRYLEASSYNGEVRFSGLHCLVDIAKLSGEWAEELVSKPDSDFPAAAVYVGHYADDYLAQTAAPYALAVFVWDMVLGKSRVVSLTAKLV